MSKKQTATEYLLIKLLNKFPKEMEYLFSLNNTLIQDTFNEAKEMEKQQIISALKAGVNFEINCNIDSNTNLTYDEYFIKYYNKTYKK